MQETVDRLYVVGRQDNHMNKFTHGGLICYSYRSLNAYLVLIHEEHCALTYSHCALELVLVLLPVHI